MSVAPHAGIVDFGTFKSPVGSISGIQGEVPAPLAAQTGYFLSTNGWSPPVGISGTATLDFGSGNKTAEVVVTGLPETVATSRVMATMRIQATASHPVDDLLVDPIRVHAKSLVAGVGLTVYGEMDNAEANGLYLVDWLLLN